MKARQPFGVFITATNSRGRQLLTMLLFACSLLVIVSLGATCAIAPDPPADSTPTDDPPADDPPADDPPGDDPPAGAPECRPPCDNNDVCDGAESCVDGECVTGTPLDCDDGLFCTGEETCDSRAGCMSSGDPCAAGETCNEDTDSCDLPPELEVTGALPNQGPAAGGTLVLIEGADFRDPMLVLFGDTVSPDVRVLGSSLLTAISPASDQELVDLRILHSDGREVVLSNAFTFIFPPPRQIGGGGPPSPGNDTDTDGDGLLDRIETAGRTILIDISGFGPGADGGHLTARLVTSDPRNPDTDGDGLDDLEEFILQTDPPRQGHGRRRPHR